MNAVHEDRSDAKAVAREHITHNASRAVLPRLLTNEVSALTEPVDNAWNFSNGHSSGAVVQQPAWVPVRIEAQWRLELGQLIR